MELKIKLVGDPILREKTKEVISITPEIEELIASMKEYVLVNQALGLAANQVGFPLNLFIFKSEKHQKLVTAINAYVISETESIDFEEACLSIPGAVGRTKRFSNLTLRYSVPENLEVMIQEEFSGLDAICIQHEIDHLEGKLYIDQLGPTSRDLVLRKHKKHLRST